MKRKKAIYHTYVMKSIFLCKRARPDVEPAVSFLSTRTTKSDETDWGKLVRTLGFLKGTRDEILTLEADDIQILTWCVDAVFAVHPDMKSHTGMVFTLEKGEIISSSTQKVNARSSTESELVASDNKLGKIISTKFFMEHQDFKIKVNLIYQGNTNTMKLQNNGRLS